MSDLFPAGLAEGQAFCNRVDERKMLKANIANVNHTVLVAPRRYGKSSLVKKVMDETSVHYAWVDFLAASSQKQVERQIGHAVAQLIYQIAPDLKKLQLNFSKFFKSMHPDFMIQVLGSSLSLHSNFEQSIAIDEALLGLDAYAQEVGKKAVIMLDEFQQISLLKEHRTIEALIRHAVERSKAITYIFSGSNRRLLTAMFSGSDRPLYKLCWAMPLERINIAEYEKFINASARKNWGSNLTPEVFQEIMAMTEQHPFYVNGLCNRLWQQKKQPTIVDVQQTWEWYVRLNRATIVADIIDLSANQKKVLTALATHPSREVFSKEFSTISDIPVASTRQVIDVLLSKDLIFQDETKCYRVLDPAVRRFLLTH